MTATAKPFKITDTHEQILASLNRYYVMHAKQINRLVFGNKSEGRMYTLCLELKDAGYVVQEDVGRSKRGGNQYTANMLSGKGWLYLKDRGYEVAPRVRRTESPDSNPFFLHTFAVNNFLIRAEQLAKRYPELSLDSLIHEHTVKRDYGLKVSIPPNNRTYTARVDGFVQFTVREEAGFREYPIALEVDRDTTKDKNDFKKKVYALIMAKRLGYYKQAFGARRLHVAFTTPSEKRRITLMNWTGEALETMESEEDEISAFSFTDQLITDDTAAEDVFLAPVWYRFDQGEQVPLIEFASPVTHEQRFALPN